MLNYWNAASEILALPLVVFRFRGLPGRVCRVLDVGDGRAVILVAAQRPIRSTFQRSQAECGRTLQAHAGCRTRVLPHRFSIKQGAPASKADVVR